MSWTSALVSLVGISPAYAGGGVPATGSWPPLDVVPLLREVAEHGGVQREQCQGLRLGEEEGAGKTMTKRELEELIHGVAGAMVYGLYTLKYTEADEPRMIAHMSSTGIKFQAPDGSYEGLEAAQVHARYSNAADLKTSKSNFVFVLRSALLRFGYESILLYCEENGHKAIMKTEAWCDWARVVRNVVSHGEHSVLRKWPPEWCDPKKPANKKSAVTWRHRTIREADVGKVIDFDVYDAWKLYLDMIDFVSNRLP
jgi:hypothetical protein